MIYEFKRTMFYEIQEALSSDRAIFLLGPRKCGKTVCLKQISEQIPDTVYVDIKQEDEDAVIDLIDNVISSIRTDEKITYLLDEVTYMPFPEKTIARIANELTSSPGRNTRVVFAGSQSVAIKTWGRRAFGGFAKFVCTDFLTYPEWLAYKGRKDITEKSYNDFISGTREFYGDFESLDEYLRGCIDETVLSNLKSSNVLFGNKAEKLDAAFLKTLMYATLISLQDRPVQKTFFDRDMLFKTIRYSLKEHYRKLGMDNVLQRIDGIFRERFIEYTSTDIDVIRQGLVFLCNCGLITVCSVTGETVKYENIVDAYKDLSADLSEAHYRTKADIFQNINISVNYPMFYVEILKDILGEYMPDKLPGDILGGIVECHVRGILPKKGSYEYHNNENENEVDYVNFLKEMAVEISIRDKRIVETHFADLDPKYEKLLLGKTITDDTSEIKRLPYYSFIYGNSVPEPLLKKLAFSGKQKGGDCR